MPLPLAARIEGLLFVAERPLTAEEIARVAGESTRAVAAALAELQSAWRDRGIMLQEQGGAYLLVSHPDVAPDIRRLLGLHRGERLTKAVLETLAIVAYYQPVTRAEIERMRGVNADHTLAVLIGRELVAAGERRQTPGRPIEYGTTFEFLKHFGLTSLADLPDRERFLAAAAENDANREESEAGDSNSGSG